MSRSARERFRNLVLLLAGLFALPSPAQTLEEFLISSRSGGLQRQGALGEARARIEDVSAASGSLLPSVSLRGGYSRNQFEARVSIPNGAGGTDEAVIQPYDLLDATARVDVPLVDVSRWKRIEAGEALVAAAEARVDDVTLATDREIVRSFHDALVGDRLETLALKSIEVAKALVAEAQARVAAGRGSNLEVERAKTQVARENQRLVDARKLAITARRRLASASGREPAELVARNSAATPTSAALPAAELAPVRVAVAEAEAIRHQASVATATLFPTLSAFGTERITNATGFIGQAATWTLGVELAWRGDFGALAARRSLQAAGEAAEARAAFAVRQAADRAFAAEQEVAALLERVEATRAEETSATEAVRIARERESAGTTTQLERLQSERDLADASANRTRSELELDAARLLLRLERGESLVGAGGRS